MKGEIIMKKNITAILCGVLAAAIIITGSLLSFGKLSENESIGSSAALNIALNDAGYSRNEVSDVKSVFERENGKYIFDVEFYANSTEYDYDIDASTGEILKREAEKRSPKVTTPTEAKTTQSTTKAKSEETTKKNNKQEETETTTTEKSTSKYIGLEEAKRIALKRAGLSVSDVKFTKAKIDYEDGAEVYEIEFVKGNTEYEFDISATSGKILDFDQETHTSSTKKSSRQQSNNDDDDDEDEDDVDDEDDDNDDDNDDDDDDD